MKEKILKISAVLFLVAALVVAGVYPITSQAAAKGTTYNVVIQKPSPGVTYISIAGGAPGPTLSDNTGMTFQMVVDAKTKTEKVKSTGQTATYYPVTIIAKSFKAPVLKQPMPGGDMTITTEVMTKDVIGKLYTTSGGDVDISSVMGSKLATKIGDGTADPAGSMIFDQFTLVTVTTLQKTGKVFLQTSATTPMTTGKSYIAVKGSKSRLEGKALPNDDTTKTVPTPLVGQPVDLNAGTGTLVGTGANFNVNNKTMGMMDMLLASVFVMKITKQ